MGRPSAALTHRPSTLLLSWLCDDHLCFYLVCPYLLFSIYSLLGLQGSRDKLTYAVGHCITLSKNGNMCCDYCLFIEKPLVLQCDVYLNTVLMNPMAWVVGDWQPWGGWGGKQAGEAQAIGPCSAAWGWTEGGFTVTGRGARYKCWQSTGSQIYSHGWSLCPSCSASHAQRCGQGHRVFLTETLFSHLTSCFCLFLAFLAL